MAKISVDKPEIMTISYLQTKGDKDYGSCLWARFNFDLKHYSLTIESDCGNFSHGWVPTPDSESFLHLCTRFNWKYLLHKISSLTVIDGEATFQKVKELMEQLDDDVFASIDEETMEEIENACYGHQEDTAAYMAICDILGENGFSEYDSYDVACCVEKDYPAAAKTIARIYRDYIQPEVRKLEKEGKEMKLCDPTTESQCQYAPICESFAVHKDENCCLERKKEVITYKLTSNTSPELGKRFDFPENIQIEYAGYAGTVTNEIAIKMADRYEDAVIEQIAMAAKAAGMGSCAVLNKAAILEALEKQMPERPELVADGYDDSGNLIYDTGYCPRCRCQYEVDYHAPKYCENCGQALDWGNDNGK